MEGLEGHFSVDDAHRPSHMGTQVPVMGNSKETASNTEAMEWLTELSQEFG